MVSVVRRCVSLRVCHEREVAFIQAVWLGLEQVDGLRIQLETPKVQTPRGWGKPLAFDRKKRWKRASPPSQFAFLILI